MTNENPEISIIIVNWNGKKFLKKCLDSLRNQTYQNFEIIFVDNGSNDGSVKFIKVNFPEIKIIENKNNLGFAAGNNQGIKESTGKYIFTLNNDTTTDNNCIENIIKPMKNDNSMGMVAPKILSLRNKKIIDSVGGLLLSYDGIAKGNGRNEIDNGQYDENKEILFPSACAALYNKRMLDEIGLFDEYFFAYCEDADLGLRGRTAGWKAISAPNAIIYHYYSGTTESHSPLKAFLVERNHILFAIKNLPLIMVLALPATTIWRFTIQFFGIIANRGSASKLAKKSSLLILFTILIKAYSNIFLKAPVFFKKRFIIKKQQKITNYEFRQLLKKFHIPIKKIALID